MQCIDILPSSFASLLSMSFPLALVVYHSFRAGKMCTSENGNTFLSEKHRRRRRWWFSLSLALALAEALAEALALAFLCRWL